MSFGDFYIRICEQLKAGYGWKGAVMYLAVRPKLMNIVYDEYRIHITDASPLEFQGVIESTALKVDQGDRTAVA
jgi:hypothetical protein